MEDRTLCAICGTPSEPDAHFCKNCGNPLNAGTPQARRVYRGHLSFYIVLILVGALIAAGVFLGKGPSGPEVPQGYLEFSVKLYNTELTLTNENDYDVHDLVVAINPKTGQEGFLMDVQTLAAGDTIALHTNEFINDSGSKFNSLGVDIIRVKVISDTPKGRLEWETEDVPSS